VVAAVAVGVAEGAEEGEAVEREPSYDYRRVLKSSPDAVTREAIAAGQFGGEIVRGSYD
jgi:hypothetical protein